jgi:hypothetical protein
MQFSLLKWRNSFTHAFWVTNDLSAADLVPAVFCQTEKNAQAKDQVYMEYAENIQMTTVFHQIVSSLEIGT